MEELNYCIYVMKSGLKYSMDKEKHTKLELNENRLLECEGYIVAREYFTQLCQVIAIFILLFLGYTKFHEILICNLIIGVFCEFFYTILPLYKIIIIPSISNFVGVYIFRFFIHFIIIGILSFTIFNNGWILLYCIGSGIITYIIVPLVVGYNKTLQQNNEIADYVLKKI